jgi:hypothetical protein
MGKEKTSTQGSTTTVQQVTPQPTAEERELNRIQLEREKKLDPQITQMQSVFLDLANRMGLGQELPGYLEPLPHGISEDVTKSIVDEALRDITPSFQQSGLLDSGVRASVSARTAGDIRRASAEFNIGNLQNLLNLALSGQAQVQQPVLAKSAMLSQRLAGLRSQSMTGSGTSSSVTLGMNPFMKSFQTGLGTSLGEGTGKMVTGGMGHMMPFPV